MENWKSIKDYEGLYEISDWGNVRSLNYGRTGKTKLLKPVKNINGYLFVRLCKDGKRKYKYVHRLVAEAFLPNPLNLPEVNHKSECPMLNFACVLEYCDKKYNLNYGTRNQRAADSKSIAIEQFDLNSNFIKRWKSATEAERQLGISCGRICDCLKGRQKTSGGFVWKYYLSEK